MIKIERIITFTETGWDLYSLYHNPNVIYSGKSGLYVYLKFERVFQVQISTFFKDPPRLFNNVVTGEWFSDRTSIGTQASSDMTFLVQEREEVMEGEAEADMSTINQVNNPQWDYYNASVLKYWSEQYQQLRQHNIGNNQPDEFRHKAMTLAKFRVTQDSIDMSTELLQRLVPDLKNKVPEKLYRSISKKLLKEVGLQNIQQWMKNGFYKAGKMVANIKTKKEKRLLKSLNTKLKHPKNNIASIVKDLIELI